MAMECVCYRIADGFIIIFLLSMGYNGRKHQHSADFRFLDYFQEQAVVQVGEPSELGVITF